jgi:hypothetical protein
MAITVGNISILNPIERKVYGKRSPVKQTFP